MKLLMCMRNYSNFPRISVSPTDRIQWIPYNPMLHVCSARLLDRCVFLEKNQTTTHWSNKMGIIMFNVDCWPLFRIYLFMPYNQTEFSSMVVSHHLPCWGFLVKLWWVQMVCGLIKLLICMFDIHPPGEWWLIKPVNKALVPATYMNHVHPCTLRDPK